MATKGRPTKYLPAYVVLAEYMAKVGATDAQMAEAFEVSVETFYTWKDQHPDFLEAIKRGKEDPDGKVERSLFQMATGYTYETEKALVVSDGQGAGSHIEKVLVRETIPPNPTSMIFWLKNRKPKEWRDKQEVQVAASVEIKHTFDPEGV